MAKLEMTSALDGRFWGRMAFARASHDDPEMTSFAPSACVQLPSLCGWR